MGGPENFAVREHNIIYSMYNAKRPSAIRVIVHGNKDCNSST
jgi:hypothetical protein